MDAVKEQMKRSDVMRELAIQEKDLSLQWRGGKGQLLYVKLKKTKTLEAWVNKQITKDTIHEISSIKIIKNGRALNLTVSTEKSTYRYSHSGKYEAPVFYIATAITKEKYDRVFAMNLEKYQREGGQ